MKATWNRIVQTLKGRRSTPLPEAGTEPVLDADLQGIPPTTGPVSASPLNWAYLLPTARTVRWLAAGAVVAAAGLMVYRNPPVQHLAQGDLGVRLNQFTGAVSLWRDGSVWVVPGLHTVRVFSPRDQSYRPEAMRQATGSAPLQSVEGLSLGLDLSVRYALDPNSPAVKAGNLPDNVGADIVEPAVQGLVYKVFARYTVREIFSSKRAEIAQIIETELRTRLAADGVTLRSIQIGKVDLPAEYRRGMDSLLAEELASEKMRYTLELKDKRVKETELDASADKVRREVAAEAAAREQVIAAKAQEEAMTHVLPFKQRQIEQRQLEAEAEKVSRIKAAEGNAQARRIGEYKPPPATGSARITHAHTTCSNLHMTQEGCCRCSPLLGRAPLRTCVLKGHDTPVLTLASADEPRPRLHGERLLTQPPEQFHHENAPSDTALRASSKT